MGNPCLYFGYVGNNTSITFSDAFSLLQANNATRTGNTVSGGAGSTNSANDGFTIQMLGTYGPGSNLVFQYANATAGVQSMTFTVGGEFNKTPGPLPLLGAGVAFRYSRRLRQRVSTTR